MLHKKRLPTIGLGPPLWKPWNAVSFNLVSFRYAPFFIFGWELLYKLIAITFTPGEANDDQFPSWFAHGAHAQTVFDRPASSIQDLFAIPKSPSPDSPSLSNIHLRDKSTQELKIGSSGATVKPTNSKPTTSLLHKLQLEKESKPTTTTNKRPLPLNENHSPPTSKKSKDNDFSSQEMDDFGDDIPIEDLNALLAITEDMTDAAPDPQPSVAVSNKFQVRSKIIY